MDFEKTLCKECSQCKTYIYEDRFKQGRWKNEIYSFKYCEKNKKIAKLGEWTVKYPKEKKKSPIVNKKSRKYFTSYLKEDKNNMTEYVNSDHHDLTLKNLRELPKSLFIHKYANGNSIYPGVRKSKNKTKPWRATIKRGNRKISLGNYKTEIEAAHAYYTKCEKIGKNIGKETKTYKSYKEQADLIDFKKNKRRKRKIKVKK